MSKKWIISLVAGLVGVAAITSLVVFLVTRDPKDNPAGTDNIPTQAVADDPSKGGSGEGGSGGESYANDPSVTGLCEVHFALPSFSSTQDREYTTLPETVLVPVGTAIGDLETPRRISSLFMGWSYDEDGNNRPEMTDLIEDNMTLYPRFALKDGMGASGVLTYVAKEQVPSDFQYELISYSLTEDEVKALLSLENASLCEKDLPFTLISVNEAEQIAQLTGLGLNEEAAGKVSELIRIRKNDGSYSLLNGLTELSSQDPSGSGNGLTMPAIMEIVRLYAPQEIDPDIADAVDDQGLITVGTGSAQYADYDETVRSLLKSAEIDLTTSTEDEIKAYYGLAKDDSLQRFWREDVGLTMDQVLQLEQLVLGNRIEGDRWFLRSKDGFWEGGDLYSVAIADTTQLRFIYDGEPTDPAVVEYNIKVEQKEVVNINVAPQVRYIGYDKVQGVDFINMLDLETDENGDITALENYKSGTMTYSGEETFAIGDVIAVHDAPVDERGFTDGNVTYVKVTNVLGNGQYAYEHAALEDVLFLADNIPVPDDGSLNDGTVTVPASLLDFGSSVYEEFGLNKETVIEKGDYLTFYTGTLGGSSYKATGYGLIKSVTVSNGTYIIDYDISGENEVMSDELLLYMQMPEVDINLTAEEGDELNKEMEQQILGSGIVEETADFLTAVVTGDDIDFDSLEHGDELLNMAIHTDEGDITLEELRLLAGGANKVEVSDVHVTFLMGIDLEHFDGKGLRAEAAVWFTIEIAIGDAGKLEIQPVIALEQEILLTPTVKVKRHKNKVGTTSSLDITASLKAGTYSGLGVSVTAKTKANDDEEDKDWEETVGNYLYNGDDNSLEGRKNAAKGLITAGNILKGISTIEEESENGTGFDYTATGDDETKFGEDSRQEFVSPGIGGDLPTKYSNFLNNDAEYIDIVNKDLGSVDFPVDPMGIIHLGMKINFTVSMKINCMIGAGISYANAKEYSYSFRARIWGGGDEGAPVSSGSSEKDIETPNFRADFYAFGMVGAKAGVGLDLRIGLLSTDLASVGVVCSAGLYAELYGFLYCWYEWTSGQGSTSGAMGSLKFEIGIYTDISVKVQFGAGIASKSWSLYGTKTPLLELGCKEYPIDFVIDKNDDSLSLEIKSGENTVEVPDELFEIKMMALNSGEIDEQNMDSKLVCETDAKTYTATIITEGTTEETKGVQLSTTRSWTQYNEDHFVVECFDLEKEGGAVKTGPSSFQYMPATNEIYICPIDTTVDEVWGKVVFTFKNTAFGFSTQALQRTVYVHWKGEPRTAKVEYVVQGPDDSNDWRTWSTIIGTGDVSGYDGIRCYVEVNENLFNLFAGYQLQHLGYPDEDELKAKYEIYAPDHEAKERHYHALARRETEARYSASKTDSYGKSLAELEKEADVAFAEWQAVRGTYLILKNLYFEFKAGNDKALFERSGNTWFTMRGTDTVIRLYYKLNRCPAAWNVIEEGAMVPLVYSENDIAYDLPLGDYMPEQMKEYEDERYTLKWYLYPYPDNVYNSTYFRRYNATNQGRYFVRNMDYSEFQPYDENMTISKGVFPVIYGILTPNEYTVHWMASEDEEFTSTKIRFQSHVDVPADKPDKDGFVFSKWTYPDGTPYEPVQNYILMPDHEIYFYADYVAKPQNITWVTEDYETITTSVRRGESLYAHIPEELRKEGYEVVLFFRKNGIDTVLGEDFTVGDQNLIVYSRFSLGFQTITWVTADGSTASRTEIGKMPERPSVSPGAEDAKKGNTDLAWILDDGTVMDDYFTMPDHPVKATAYWHKHSWMQDAVTVEATCVSEGKAGFKCELCGMIKADQILPVDPDNHGDGLIEIGTKAATCSEKGWHQYHCIHCDQTVFKEIPIDPDNHTPSSEIIGYVLETCGKDGYTGDVKCKDCGEIIEHGKVVPATGEHIPGSSISVIKVSTCSEHGYGECTCSECGQIYTLELELEPDAHTWTEDYVIISPTCGETGMARFTCTGCHLVKTDILPATGAHSFDRANGVVVKENTCSEHGILRVTCTVCGQTRDLDNGWDPDNHIHLSDPEILEEATCLAPGRQRRECLDCGRTVFETIPALEAEWGEVTYTWAANNRSVTASMPCLTDHSFDRTETVAADSRIISNATCDADGRIQYTTRAFTTYPDVFTQQTKTERIAATGHSWGEVSVEWDLAGMRATASRICSNDASHTESETVTITKDITRAATATQKGEETYTAVFTEAVFGTRTKKVETDSTDADWNAIEYEWAADMSSVRAYRTSRTDPSLVEEETSTTIASRVITAVSCETDGETEYTAVFTTGAFAGTYTETVVQEALGHDYVILSKTDPQPIIQNIEGYDQCTGWETGSQTLQCSHDPSHIVTETLKVKLALYTGEGNEVHTVSGSSITVDMDRDLRNFNMSVDDEYKKASLAELFEVNPTLEHTAKAMLAGVSVFPYNDELMGWWSMRLPDDLAELPASEQDEWHRKENMQGALFMYPMGYGVPEDHGQYVFKNPSDADLDLTDLRYAGQRLTFEVAFVPDDEDIFETLELTVTYILPRYPLD
ncbi:MAG: hypothetical protein K6E62_13825 [Lachnospiraceae bacterium]|nr:hypothetical protein [Lachnospiraceae bacterium]